MKKPRRPGGGALKRERKQPKGGLSRFPILVAEHRCES
jgi:hypothetical protein